MAITNCQPTPLRYGPKPAVTRVFSGLVLRRGADVLDTSCNNTPSGGSARTPHIHT